MFTQVLSVLTLIKQVLDGAMALQKMIKENREEKWFQQSAETFVQLSSAKNSEERKNAARNLAKLYSNF